MDVSTPFKPTSHKFEHIFTAQRSQMPLKNTKLISKTIANDVLKMDPSAAFEYQQSASYTSIYSTSLKIQLELGLFMFHNEISRICHLACEW
jgi:hypothetical protein